MVKPISYLQTDSRWKNHNYYAKGESKTIGSAGCGPTAAAMVIATIKDKNVTPITTAEWSMAHGYKALNQGTYYTYFIPQFSVYGIASKRLNTSNLYGKSTSSAHTEALNALKNGDWVIACMGKGNWTTSGHFILLYGYENGYVYINDPASTAANRVKNTWDLFAKQVKYLWTVTVPDSFKKGNNGVSLTGSTVEERVANFLYSKIKNIFGVFGLMGNLRAESGLIFNRVEILCLKKLKENGKPYTDSTYTSAVDSGKISRAEFLNPLPRKRYGYGLAQWTSTDRKAKLYDLVKQREVSIADEQAQLDYLWQELSTTYSNVLSILKNAKSVREASDAVLRKFESPADQSEAVKKLRASYGEEYYKNYAGKLAGAKEDEVPTAYSYTRTQFIKDVQSATGSKVDGIAGSETLGNTVTVSLTKNKNHEVVTPLERWLKELGYYTGSIEADEGKTPIFGSGMDKAVKAFQDAKDCVSDGEITAQKKTWKKLLGMI